MYMEIKKKGMLIDTTLDLVTSDLPLLTSTCKGATTQSVGRGGLLSLLKNVFWPGSM